MPGWRRRRLTSAVAIGAMLGSLLGMAPGVLAGSVIGVTTTNQEINGDGFCSLQEAIYAANLDDSIAPDPTSPGDFVDTACVGGDGADIIELPPMSVFTFADPITDADNYVGPSATPIITSEIIIEGRGARLQRHALGRLTRAFVVGGNGFLDLREVHVNGFFIRGGDGGAGGGGGGMGAGGAIYVQGGRLLVQWSTFEANGVRGGDGGDENNDAGGGGGGLSGNGGSGDGSGGGGGGSRGDGGHGRTSNNNFWGGGGGGRVTSGSNETPGEPCGGAGGESSFAIGGDGDSASFACPGGGGGGGSGASDLLPGNGGSASYGGGGGGGGSAGLTSGDGGDGGFGGGGGGADNQGGHGGFGAGGGLGFEAFSVGHGQGGTFAGDGSGRAGGGGAGLGGAIFGYLADIDVVNSTFFGNSAERGESGLACAFGVCSPAATNGRGAGGAVFTVGGDLAIESSTFAGNESVTVTGGGGGAIVVYDPIGDDEATLVLRNTIVANNGAAECYTRNGVSTTGSAGNLITDSSANNLDDPACPGVISSDDPQLGPLLLNAPGRTPTLAIPVTSPAADAAVGGTSPLDDQRGVARPQGSGPDIGAYEVRASESGNLAPTTTITLSPAAPDGANGWYVSAVGVTVGGTDPDGTIGQTRCALDPASAPATFDDLPDAACSVSSVTTDGQHAIYAASRDDGGAVSPVVSAALKIDQTPPTLSPTISSTTVQVGQTGVTASPNASDDWPNIQTSGVASSSCGAIDTSTPGDHTVTCTATDNAGNTASATVHYVVEYQILGFFSPVPLSKWMVGQMVPIKIALGNADGTRISDAEATELARSCRVQFSVEGAQTKSAQCMKYDAKNDQFIFNWKLAKQGDGLATITVTVSYPGTTWTTQLSAEVTITP